MNISDVSPNEIILQQTAQINGGGFLSDSNYFWMVSTAIFLIAYFSLAFSPMHIKKGLRVAIALLIPVMIDLILSFGTFTFYFPLDYNVTVDRGVMFLTLLNKIFTFEIFSFYSSPILTPFISAASQTTDSIFVFAIGFLSAGIDSIMEFIFFVAFFYFILSWIEDKIGTQINYQLGISIALASIPTILYSLLVSNPFKEIGEIIQITNGMLTFFASGNLTDIIFIIVLFLINFSLIVYVVYVFIEILFGLYMKVNYNKRGLEWDYDYVGIAVAYTFAYSLLFFLHSNYKFYVVFPSLFVLQALKNSASGMINRRKQNKTDEERMAKVFRERNEQIDERFVPTGTPRINREAPRRFKQGDNEFSISNIVIALLVLAGVLLIYYFLLA